MLGRAKAFLFLSGVSDARRAELRLNAVKALHAQGEPDTPESKAQYFELYKMMVASSEALVARRQGVNTFFLTINGLLLTAIGLFVQSGREVSLGAGGILVLAVAGLSLCLAWRTLLVSFGQLNAGKFVIINAMEHQLAGAIYEAEWEALGRGEDDAVYRSFTTRETWVPVLLGLIYVVAIVVAFLLWTGIWSL